MRRILFFLLLVCASAAAAQDFSQIDRIFQDFAERQHVPGAVWGVIIDGKLAHRGAYGVRDTGTKSAPDADTVFRIASMTKSFTALSILKLRDAGKLALDDPAEKYVPELAALKYPSTDSPKITVRQLLSHSEGFPEDNPWGDQQLALTEQQFTALLREGVPFSNAPGVAYEYSNLGFMILGRMVERVSGMRYPDFVRANILRPLGMNASTLEPSQVPPERLAHGYRWEDEQWKEERQLPYGAGGPMGGMMTSINDLSKYVAMYLSAWPPHDGPETAPARRASLREMQRAWSPTSGTITRDATSGAVELNAGGYGFGLRSSQSCTFRRIISHGGGLPGFGTIMMWLPDYNAGIIAFGNRTYTGWTPAATQSLELLAKSGTIKERQPQPAPALMQARDDVSRLIMQWDDALADRIAAMNLYLDQAKDRRRRQIEQLRAQVGQCSPPSGFDYIENALRGKWTLSCERGKLEVAITLAPTMPPKVQRLDVHLPTGEPARPETCRVQ